MKTVLLIDCVEWDSVYPEDHSLRDVSSWFGATFNDKQGAALMTISAWDKLKGVFDQNRIDGVLMSGSPLDAWKDDLINDKLCRFVEEVQRRSIPFLGVCFGHQILARALGGKVNRNPKGLQLGNVRVRRTEEGARSPLFDGFSDEPEFLCGHADAVLELPEGAARLASSGQADNQAFQIGEAMFGVQFHPEFTPEILRFLWTPRIEAWRERTTLDIQQTLDGLKPVPQAPRLFVNFLRLLPL